MRQYSWEIGCVFVVIQKIFHPYPDTIIVNVVAKMEAVARVKAVSIGINATVWHDWKPWKVVKC
ncbi:MAG: hypothetical protein PHE53_09495 [Thermoguttaceae bacterium]|nr:hypothetical protein [Thermoguttaceae bacterium]